MRYLQNRNDFLNKKVQLDSSKLKNYYKNSEMLRESAPSVTNDITFGGSLIGRFINSIYRKARIYIKGGSLQPIIKQVEVCLDTILGDLLSDETKKNVKIIGLKYLLYRIYLIVMDQDIQKKGNSAEVVAKKWTLKSKLNLLIGGFGGGGEGGMVNEAIKKAKELDVQLFEEKFFKKDDLIKRLEEFEKLLKAIEETEEEEEEEENFDDEDDEDENEEIRRIKTKFFNATVNLIENIVKLTEEIEDGIAKGTDKKGIPQVGEDWILSKDDDKIVVKILSRKNIILPSGDGVYLDGNDTRGAAIPNGNVFVVRKNKNELSVGAGGKNKFTDVLIVQKKLKENGFDNPITGICKGETIKAIKEFGKKNNIGGSLIEKGNPLFKELFKNEEDATDKIKTCFVGKGFTVRVDGNLLSSAKFQNILRSKKTENTGGGGKEITSTTNVGDEETEKEKVNLFLSDEHFESIMYDLEMLPVLEDKNVDPGGNISKFRKKVMEILVRRYNDGDSGLKKYLSIFKSLLDEYKEPGDDLDKNRILKIGMRVMENEDNIGIPMKYKEELLKEGKLVDNAQNEEIAKCISLLMRILLAFRKKDKVEPDFDKNGKPSRNYLLRNLEDIGKIIYNEDPNDGDILTAYNKMDKLYPWDFGDEDEEDKKDQKQEDKGTDKKEDEKKNDNQNHIFDYKKFRLFEAGEDQDSRKNIGSEDPAGEEYDESDPDDKDDDVDDNETEPGNPVKDAWEDDKTFKKIDGKKFEVTDEDLKDFNDDAEKVQRDAEEKKPQRLGDDGIDAIMRIVNLFGKAYKIYATDYIPSGRPMGRVSLKTFREYEYIGKSDSSRGGEWPGDGPSSGAPQGPFAIKMLFNIWEDGIEGLLEKKKYRKVLANPNLQYAEKREGSGTTGSDDNRYSSSDSGWKGLNIREGMSLYKFINSMINPEGGFKRARRKLIDEYFGGVEPTKGGKAIGDESEMDNNSGKIKNRDKSDKVCFKLFNGTDTPQYVDALCNDKHIGKFFNIKVKSGSDTKYLIGYFFNYRASEPKKLVMIYNISSKETDQEIITEYLKNKDIELDEESIKLKDGLSKFVGIVDKKEDFVTRKKTKIKQAKIIGRDAFDTAKDVEYEIDGPLTILADKNNKAIQVKGISKDLTMDSIKKLLD
jgi:hypothetical protein